jgi:hypothetical protein
LVIPAIARVACALPVRAQVPLLSARVIVTVPDVFEPVAEQLENPPVNAIVGVGGMKNELGKTAVIVSPDLSNPPELGVN